MTWDMKDIKIFAQAKRLRVDLILDLGRAQEVRENRFAAIVRFVRRREARGPAKDMMAQIRSDNQLCKLLVDYEAVSEIIGMMADRNLRTSASEIASNEDQS